MRENIMSFKSKYGQCNTVVSKSDEIADYGVMLLNEHGYEKGNSYGYSAYAISNEYGVFAVEIGHEYDVLDVAVDNNKMDGQLMSDTDHAEYESEGWDDSYILLGNASEPFWCVNLAVNAI